MRIRPRGAAEDCCCSSLKDNVKWLMERIGGTVRKLIINGNEYTPDGDGTVTLDTSTFVDVDDHLDNDSMKPIANKPVTEAVQALSDADSVLNGKITTNEGAIEDLQDDVDDLEDAVQGQGSQISDMQGSIAGLAADNAYTRSIAQGAADTANGLADRITNLETNDAVQQSQIGQLIVADQGSAKLAGDNAFTGNNSFAVNPKAAAPENGAVDTSVVNANWASQTGDDAPNNLSHRYGNETEYGIRTFDKPILGRMGDWKSTYAGTGNIEDIKLFAKLNMAGQGRYVLLEMMQSSNTAICYGIIAFTVWTGIPTPFWIMRRVGSGGNNPMTTDSILIVKDENDDYYLASRKKSTYGNMGYRPMHIINYGAEQNYGQTYMTQLTEAVNIGDGTGYTLYEAVE